MTAAADMTFDDEFNSLSLWNGYSGTWDTTAPYATLDGNGFTRPNNGEQQWYINSNYGPTSSVQPWSVNNGLLTLTAAPASSAISSLINGYQYTSGDINTSQSFSQTYGYFEMRAQLPSGQGLWPAFWLLPENNSWPPEIDAMEMLGNNPGVYYTSAHSGSSANEVNVGQADTVANTSSSYHTFGVDWEPDHLTYYFDGQQVYQTATPWDMNSPMYMIANLAVGGTWPGDADWSTPFPASMNVDWIRAYSSLPAWVADGSDGADINHTPWSGATATNGGGADTGGSQTASSAGDGSTPTGESAASFTVPDNVTHVVLTGGSAQMVFANGLGDTITSNDHGSTLIGGPGNDTFIAGHNADIMTGGGGSNTYVFNAEPWNAGHITDFNPAIDKLDLSGVLQSIGYTGTNPVGDGYLSFVDNGNGGTLVEVTAHNGWDPWATTITTLDHVSPWSITAADYGTDGSSGTSGSSTSSTISTTSTASASAAAFTTTSSYDTVPSWDNSAALTGWGSQTIVANNSGDTITSNDYGSTLIGGTGNDTLIAGHGADQLTGGGGNDSFVFNAEPWSAGHITDFNPTTDVLNLTGLFKAIGYTGSNPVADGYLTFASDGAGNTQVIVNDHSGANPWGTLVTTLDHVSPWSLGSQDYAFHA